MSRERRLRVQFIHGLESSPQGNKARFLAVHFESLTPAMDTSDFEGSVLAQREALADFRPDVLVGSSFGGAVAGALLSRGAHTGPTLLLAPALGRFAGEPRLPPGARVLVVHGIHDDIVPIDVSRAFAAAHPDSVRLVEVDDGHRLDSLIATGSLAGFVKEAAALVEAR